MMTDHPGEIEHLTDLLTNAPCVVENPWGAQWDGPCTGSVHIHVPCAVAAVFGSRGGSDG